MAPPNAGGAAVATVAPPSAGGGKLVDKNCIPWSLLGLFHVEVEAVPAVLAGWLAEVAAELAEAAEAAEAERWPMVITLA